MLGENSTCKGVVENESEGRYEMRRSNVRRVGKVRELRQTCPCRLGACVYEVLPLREFLTLRKSALRSAG